MAETLQQFFSDLGLSPYAVIFMISMLPFIELRGGLIAAALMGLPWHWSLLVCFLGNMLPIPFILIFIRQIFKLLRKIPKLQNTIDTLEAKTRKKGEKIQTGRLIGLTLFVGIPLPGTGAWTGALAADLFDLRIRHSLPAIAVGVALAGGIMLLITELIPGLFGFQFA